MTQPNRLRAQTLTVDTLGLVLRVFVSAANVGERCQTSLRVKRMGKAVSRVHTVWVDGAMMALRSDLGHGRLPLDCPSRITTGAGLLKKALGRRAHVRLADGVAPIG